MTKGGKLRIDIPSDQRRPIDVVQSAKLASECGIISRNILPLTGRWKDVTEQDKDVALKRLRVIKSTFGF